MGAIANREILWRQIEVMSLTDRFKMLAKLAFRSRVWLGTFLHRGL